MSNESPQTGTQQRMLDFLQDPAHYPHRPDSVRIIQTHSSFVALVDPFVYKVKKPVDFGFLDYSSLEKRRYYCEQEVELNSRLCSEMYLGIIPVRSYNGRLSFGDEGEIVDYAVKMKLLKEESFLIEKVKRGELQARDLDRTADKLKSFYLQQQPDEKVRVWGTVDKLRVSTDENFEQTEKYIGDTIAPADHQLIQYFTNQFYRLHASLLEKRLEQNRIVDGHGDLHLEHIHVTPGRVCIYDCIEFNDRFRYLDVANDVGFLAMDLDSQGEVKLSRRFIDRMAQVLNDAGLKRIIDFYKCYRAFVRGKVESMRYSEEEVPQEEREAAADNARHYFNLSLRYGALGSRPTALLFMGRIGTGKSTLAAQLGERFQLPVFASDRIRKQLGGLPVGKLTPVSKRKRLYSHDMSERTYSTLYEKALSELKQGKSVVLDATFSRRDKREEAVELFRKHGIRYYFIETETSEEVVKKRLKERENRDHVVSDARLENYETLKRIYESPTEVEDGHLLSVNTEQKVKGSVEEICRQLVEHHLKSI